MKLTIGDIRLLLVLLLGGCCIYLLPRRYFSLGLLS